MVRHISKTTSIAGLGCVILFALPFAGVGVFMGGWAITTVVEYVQIRNWQEISCTILEADLVNHSDSDGSTYEATARYCYHIDGVRYESSRVAIHSGADNIGSFQKQAGEKLQSHQQSEKPFPGLVNPNDPSDAILFHDPRWGMVAIKAVFGLVFGGAGLGMIVGVLLGRRKAAVTKQATKAHPDEPWLWKEAWASGKIKSSNKTIMWVASLFSVIWNLVSLPLLFLLPNEIIEKHNYLAAIGLLFPLIGMGLLVWAAQAVIRWRKYGESAFEMATVPGVLGGSLAGVIWSNKVLDAQDGYRQVLNCIKKKTTGSGKHRSTSETTIWQDERTIARPLSGPGQPTVVPVAFATPFQMPASTTDGGNTEVIWRLEISAAVPGIDYYAAFDVPVFKTEESRPDFKLDANLLEDYAAQRDPEQEFRRTGIRHAPAPTGQGERYTFPMLRNPGIILSLAVFTLIWTGVVVGLTIGQVWFFAVVFGLCDLLLCFAMLDVMFYRSVVDVAPDGITVRSGLFASGKPQRIEAAQLAELKPIRGMQHGRRLYYGVAAVTEDGNKITLGKRLANKPLAEVVIEHIQRSMESTPRDRDR